MKILTFDEYIIEQALWLQRNYNDTYYSGRDKSLTKHCIECYFDYLRIVSKNKDMDNKFKIIFMSEDKAMFLVEEIYNQLIQK